MQALTSRADLIAGARVLFVLPGLRAGGAERVAVTLAGSLARAGWRAAIATFEPADLSPYYPVPPDVKLRPLAVPGRGVSTVARRVRALRRALRQERPDVVVSFLTRTNIVTLLAATGLGIPVIVSERNNPALQGVGPFWSRARATLYPRAFAFVTMTRGALEFYPPRQRPRGTIIPNPVLAPERRPRPEGRTVVAVGRLDRQKGFDLLLEAFAAVAPEADGWRLVVFGEGPERAALEAQRQRLGLEGRVEFPGVTGRPGAWANEADVFVLSSRFEGFPNALAEALAAGIPSVAFDCPFGPREMVSERGGILVPDGDVPAFARALRTVLLDASIRQRLSGDGERFSARFRPEAIAAEWCALLEAALGRGVTA